MLIFANILLGALTGLFWYTVYDSYLEKEFKEEYNEWKQNSSTKNDSENLEEED